MDEKEKKETEAKATASGTDDPKDGNPAEGKTEVTTTPLIDIANAAAGRMENANKETARLQAVQAERDQRIALGGQTEAGQQSPKQTDEDKKKSQASEFFKDTALGDAIDKT